MHSSCSPRTLVFVLFAILILRLSVHAQTQASIVGTVTDPTGAALPGVRVTIINEATGGEHSVETNTSGSYDDPTLGVGTYTVKAGAPSFKEFSQVHIPLNIGDTLRIDIKMVLGSVDQAVTVTANVVQVQSSTNEVSSLIDRKQISQLDTNGRNISGLVTLSPGVTTNNADFTQPLRSGNFSINGGTTIANVFTIDDAEDMDRGSDGSNMSPSPDALSEFKVLTSNYSADYGFGGGGTIAVALKSGTKTFHGNLWEYGRNDALNANNYFANLAHTARPELRFNTFGGNFGGPLFIPGLYNQGKSKTFFFVNEEWRRYILGAVVNYTVPTAQEYTGNFSDRATAIYVPNVGDPVKVAQFTGLGLAPGTPFPGNKIPASLLDPNVQLFLKAGALPLANSGTQYIASANSAIFVREDICHIDHNFNDKFSLDGHLVHFIANEGLPASAVVSTLPTATLPYRNPAWNAAVRLNTIIRPNLINQAHFNFNANGLAYSAAGVWQQPSGWSVNKLFAGTDPLHRLPNVCIGAPYSISYGTSFLPYHNYAWEFQEADDLFWTKGKHNFKFGGAFSRYTKDQMTSISTQGSSKFNGSYTAGYSSSGSTIVAGNSFADSVLGMESAYTEGQIQPTAHMKQGFGALYGMDDWRAGDRLTVNLGVRWEALPHGYDKYNQVSNFVPSAYNQSNAAIFNSNGSISSASPGIQTVASAPGSPVALSNVPFYLNGIELATRNGLPRAAANSYWANFEPRVGAALDLFGDGKTIVRGGIGVFFHEIADSDTNSAEINPPFANSPSLNSVYFSNPRVSTINGQTISATPILPTSITGIKFDYPMPYGTQQSVGVQRQITSSAIATVAYVGAVGYNQPTKRAIDMVPLTDPNRKAIAAGTYNANLDRIYSGYAGITLLENSGHFNYNSLQATLRLQNHLGDALHLAYTYSKALGITSGLQSNPFDPSFDYGPTSLDQRHVLVADYIVPIPIPRSWSSSVVKEALGGWQVTGITYIQTGQPVTPTLGINNLGLGGGTARPDLIKPLTYPRTRLKWFDTTAYQTPVSGSLGSARAYSIRLPGRDEWNMGLFKTFGLDRDGNFNLQFRADAYNTFNHTQFATIQAGFNAQTSDRCSPPMIHECSN
jgi:hypothetical protein